MKLFSPDSNKPILIFGGPYSNAEATASLIEEAQKLSIPASNVLCTGDLVAYCASPEETITLIRQWGIAVVMGNCEESFGNDADDCGCGFDEGSACDLLSAGWFSFSKPRISQPNKQWMKTLPRRISFHYCGFDFSAIHGGIEQINQFIYASDTELIAIQLGQTQADIVLGGHCGIPFGVQTDNKAWLNAGVIGMPANDATADGWYMLLTPSTEGIECRWHRLAYNAQAAADMMQQQGLNTGYKAALLSGIWPSTDVLPAAEKTYSGKPLTAEPLFIRRSNRLKDLLIK